MIVLNVPYAEKDKARELGARWNPKSKKWYVPDGVLTTPFECWMPDGAAAAPKSIAAGATKERVDGYTGKATVGVNYFELVHDCNPFVACEQCRAKLDSSGWNAARSALS